jgi:hypothetical protein
MSLINDALKKAARQRAEEQGEIIPPMPGGGGRRVSRQGGPMGKQTLVLVVAAAVALVVVSAVITGVLMTGKPDAKAAVIAKPSPEPTLQEAPKPIVQAPVITVSLPPVAKPTPTPSPVAVAPEPPAPAQKVAASTQVHTDMVQAVVDAFHISGVRTAGAGSKALVDGHIYKLNDVLDRTLGLKLIKVDEGQLTFVDKDGNVYIRTF